MIGFSFLFWFFLIGIIMACLQDLKRREVDNWLNFFLFVGGVVFVLYQALLARDWGIVIQLGFSIITLFFVMNMFYYGRVFAGGDSKLLLALSAFFVASSFKGTIFNIGIFLLFLMVGGSVYGLIYSFIIYFKHRKASNKEMAKCFKDSVWIRYFIGFSLVVIFIGVVFNIFNLGMGGLLILFGCLFLSFPLLYIFSKALESVCMVKILDGKDLREGDWLAEDVKVKGRVIKAKWDGLREKDLKLLRIKRKVKVKEGLPFVPAFLIAFIAYAIFRGFLLKWFYFLW